ncbi:MAG: NAD(+)/NADH kinase [Muribaculaceae bacterium]|nr:NAD(+)/NADH kinase [Muribaculaceae bacterium]
MKTRTLALYGKSRQDSNLTGIMKFMAEARKKGFGLLCHEKFAAYLSRFGENPDFIPPVFSGIPEAEAAISFGGDGTFLRTARRLGDTGTPIAGVNTGNLGYLAHFTLDDAELLLDGILHHTLNTQPRRLIEVTGEGIPADFLRCALNEIAVQKDDSASMINVHVELDGFFLADYRADGLIVSTATGSTAYNLSVGGPILQPELDCMVISPVAPHSLTLRPIVVAGSSTLRLTMSSRTGSYRLSVDGYSVTMKEGTSLVLKAAPYTVNLLTPHDDTFAASLREKLLWGRS